eukprot:1004144-Pleurochrysis_carterae.AAC.3
MLHCTARPTYALCRRCGPSSMRMRLFALRRFAAVSGAGVLGWTTAEGFAQCRRLEEEQRTLSGSLASLPPREKPPTRDPAHLDDGFMERASDDKPVLVGVAGGTGSGKTTVAKAIAERLGPDQLVHISHDSYYKDQSHLPPSLRGKTNFDHPDALERYERSLRAWLWEQCSGHDGDARGSECIAPHHLYAQESVVQAMCTASLSATAARFPSSKFQSFLSGCCAAAYAAR